MNKHSEDYRKFCYIKNFDCENSRDVCQLLSELITKLTKTNWHVESCAGGVCRLSTKIIKNRERRIKLKNLDIEKEVNKWISENS